MRNRKKTNSSLKLLLYDNVNVWRWFGLVWLYANFFDCVKYWNLHWRFRIDHNATLCRRDAVSAGTTVFNQILPDEKNSAHIFVCHYQSCLICIGSDILPYTFNLWLFIVTIVLCCVYITFARSVATMLRHLLRRLLRCYETCYVGAMLRL